MKAWCNPHLVSFSRALPDFISGKRTPRDFLERCLEVVTARDTTVKAFVALNIEGARQAADAATQRYQAGRPLSPVDGCPVAVKDIIATADMPTQMGSPAFKGWHSGQDAACVAALRKGGAIIIRLYTRGWTEVDSDTDDAFTASLEALEQAGIAIASRDNDSAVARFEEELDKGVDGAHDIVAYEMRWPFEDYLTRFGNDIGERIHGLIERAQKISPADYEALLENRKRVRALVRGVAADTDGFLTLASSGPANVGLEYTGSRTFLTYGSWLGLPAFSLPLLQVNNLPLGIQLLGIGGSDGALCAIAKWIMREFTQSR